MLRDDQAFKVIRIGLVCMYILILKVYKIRGITWYRGTSLIYQGIRDLVTWYTGGTTW